MAPVPLWLFALGILTTILVMIAWGTNLVFKPPATAFGGAVTVVGLVTAYTTARYLAKRGKWMVFPIQVYGAVPARPWRCCPPPLRGARL
jgi:hypothetical protein